MSSGIFVIRDNEDLLEMEERAYETEDVLQALLATHPGLIPGSQIDGSDPRRWLLICREAGIPGEEDAGGRWSLDHLLVDQDAIPTLVEVKRSQDTRIRREVVGQMLEYAANASTYWSADTMRERFRATCEADGADADERLAAFLGDHQAVDGFWQLAEDNLRAGKLRLVFLADSVPTELQAIVEFLNRQMEHVEVLAVEVKRYAQADTTTLVSRVLGQTAAKKSKTESRQWDEASFFAELSRRCGPDEVRVARRILEWGQGNASRVWWGKGRKDGAFIPTVDTSHGSHWAVTIWTYGKAEIQFQSMALRPPFDDPALRLELVRRLNATPGISIPEDAIERRPSFALSAIAEEPRTEEFLQVLEWHRQQVLNK